jgi:acyl carrier protein
MAVATQDFVTSTLQELGVDGDIPLDRPLEELGIDSLDMAEFAQIADEQLSVVIETKDLKSLTTVGDLVSLIADRTA